MNSLTFKKLLFVSGFVLYGMGVQSQLLAADDADGEQVVLIVAVVADENQQFVEDGSTEGEGVIEEFQDTEVIRAMHNSIRELLEAMNNGFALVHVNLDALDARLTGLEGRLDGIQDELAEEREQLAADRYSRTLQGRAQGIGLFLIQASPLAPLLPMARFITSDQGRAMFDWLERRWPVPILIAVLSTPTMRYIIRIFGPRVGLKNIARIIQSRKFRWPTRILVWTCYLVLAKSLLSRSWRAATSNIQFVEQLQGDAIGTFTDVRDWFEEQVDYVRSISAVDVGNYAMRQLRQRGLYVLVPASVGGAAFAIIRYLSHLNELEEARMVAPGNNDAIREAMQRSLGAESGIAPAE